MALFTRLTSEPQLEPVVAAAPPVQVADERHAQALPYGHARPLTAAASRVSMSDKRELEQATRRRSTAKWQQDAWDYFDLIGEVKFAFRVFSSVMSRVRIYPAQITGGNVIPSSLDDVQDLPEGLAEAAQAAMLKLSSGNGGIPGILRDASLNLAVAGECYLVQTPAQPGNNMPETWSIKSVDQFIPLARSGRQQSAYGIKPRRESGANEIQPVDPRSFVGRIWQVHPRFSDDADSSMLGQLELMDELLLLSRTFKATAHSRLNAGLLFLPDELSVAGDTAGEDENSIDDPDIMAPYGDDETDSLEEDLIDAMTTPISDPSSASAVVPLIVRGPSEVGDKIKLIKFERSFDPMLAQRADKVLDRILAGLDLPKELVQGITGTQHGRPVSGMELDEALYKQHIEPMCLMLCDALTIVYLRPVLLSMGFTQEEVQRVVFWYDPSSITTKPDKASAATTGYNLHALSSDAWRRANGFADTDAPSPLELAQRIAVERGQLSEPITEALFKSLIPQLLEQVRAQSQAENPAPISGDVADALGTPGPEAPDASGLDGASIPEPGQDAPNPMQAPTPPDRSGPATPGGLLEP